ncbi:hypothetical protein FHR83_003763 [Actinoplanes campanulatus]|uniref:Uncharacterized protein n=1 Tax=Actinoplanes campanulatus TaxID=113559 RepID=A0A7W5AH32_9ACTN|nr:DUF6188 family protein [Actinoplanes campanulatus]MBB3096093.1 hypothetical protein [Actinoplanes campanulatus]GGN13625.1 hypothetical protein GCM10010109_24780 [Actinoplanes campanulatus]GID36812.1 hypothetical protein Aca09nite_33180 [Actinoplanes campanulatus]
MAVTTSPQLAALTGQRLTNVLLGHAVSLRFTGGDEVLIEGAARLDGHRIRPGDDSADALVAVLGDVVQDVGTGAGGELRISFGSGAQLVVDADADAESWAIAGADGRLIVCLANGELAVWDQAGTSP